MTSALKPFTFRHFRALLLPVSLILANTFPGTRGVALKPPSTIKMRFSDPSMHKKITVAAATLLLMATACHNNSTSSSSSTQGSEATSTPALNTANVPTFQADTAYAYVAKQVAFGPRIPNTPAQEACANWIINTAKPLADTVYVQRTTVTGPHHDKLRCINVIASFNPAAKQRVLVLAHWDTRPQADQDTGVNKNKQFDGADDGGSGVAVMLEAARQMKARKIPENVGVDFLFTDVEDSGVSEIPDSYALGTQYWAHHPHVPGYKANYGILLDMVGGKNSTFYMESTSKEKAYSQMKMFWDVANSLGGSQYFRYENGAAIDDDHVYVNNIINIPTFDVLAWTPADTFAAHWHTTHDNMNIIDKATLHIVGQTLLQVVYTQPFAY